MRLTQDQIQKTAILFLSMEGSSPGSTQQVLSELPETQAKSVLGAMSELGRLLPADCQPIIKEFYDVVFDPQAVYGGFDVAARMVQAVFGEGQAPSIIKNNKKRFQFLENIPAEDIVQFLGTETLQAKTILFHYLGPKKASELLMLLGDDPVAYTLTKAVDVPNPDLLGEVEVLWAQYFDRLNEERTLSDEASVLKLVKMMEFLPKTRRDALLKGYTQRSPKLGQRLKQLIFTFDDMMTLPDETLKIILAEPFDYRHVAQVRLQLQADWVEKINRCMSEQMLTKVDVESTGLVFNQERSDGAKQYFIDTARKLEREGAVTLRCQN